MNVAMYRFMKQREKTYFFHAGMRLVLWERRLRRDWKYLSRDAGVAPTDALCHYSKCQCKINRYSTLNIHKLHSHAMQATVLMHQWPARGGDNVPSGKTGRQALQGQLIMLIAVNRH